MSRKSLAGSCGFIVCIGLIGIGVARPQQRPAEAPPDPVQQRLQNLEESLRFTKELLSRNVDDLVLFRRFDDIAEVDKVRYTGPPPRVVKNPTAQGAGNAVIL